MSQLITDPNMIMSILGEMKMQSSDTIMDLSLQLRKAYEFGAQLVQSYANLQKENEKLKKQIEKKE